MPIPHNILHLLNIAHITDLKPTNIGLLVHGIIATHFCSRTVVVFLGGGTDGDVLGDDLVEFCDGFYAFFGLEFVVFVCCLG